MPISFRLSSRKKEKQIKRNRVLMALGLATTLASVIVVHSSQTKKTINRAYEMGVEDGLRLINEVRR